MNSRIRTPALMSVLPVPRRIVRPSTAAHGTGDQPEDGDTGLAHMATARGPPVALFAVASGAVIHLRSAVALLGGFPALAGADLDVDAGEVVLLRGANGAGKSTLLRACAGLVAIASGQAVVLGCDLV